MALINQNWENEVDHGPYVKMGAPEDIWHFRMFYQKNPCQLGYSRN